MHGKNIFEGVNYPPNIKITKVHPFSGPQNSLKLTLKKTLNYLKKFFGGGIKDPPHTPSILHFYKTPLHTLKYHQKSCIKQCS
jgi:hypothetical protein